MKMKLLAICALTVVLPAFSADPPPAVQPVNQSSAGPGLADEQVVQQFRADMMAKRADIMAKGLTLSSDQAAKFWPLFEQYQKEQDLIVNEQLTATRTYADHYKALTDADALTYVKALLTRDQKMLDLRVKWLEKFQKQVSANIAARAIQLDRRLSNVAQIQLSSQIPLVH
jgi:Spy/CpxP family protein refolding chaperone